MRLIESNAFVIEMEANSTKLTPINLRL
jgi:hypothetical protein